jgi:hypothetical protein
LERSPRIDVGHGIRATGDSLRIWFKPWVFLTLLAVLIVTAAFVAHRLRFRFVRSDADMAALLPEQGLATFFVDVEALRRAQMSGLLVSSKPAEENDYQQFVRGTGFDYARDIDAVVGEGDSTQLFFVLRGRFNWAKLRQYAGEHGGSCQNDICKVPTSTAGRFASFLAIQPNVLALSLSTDPAAVVALSPRRINGTQSIPVAPIWVRVGHSLLTDPKALPLPARIFAMALASSDSVVLSVEPDSSKRNPFELKMKAVCRNGVIADTTRKQLEIQTRMLGIELEREHQRPNPADLSGLLTAGSFQVVESSVIGSWPIRRELLAQLQ